MPSSEKVSGTGNNITRTTSVREAQSQISYRHLSGAYLLKAVFSAEPAAYVVDINGKTLDGKQVSVSWTYDACHPLMALGRAVVEFRDRYPCVTIDYLGIRQRVIKNH